MTKTDPVLSYIGNIGRWQAGRIICVFMLIGFFPSWQTLVVSFSQPKHGSGGVSYKCSDFNLGNVTDVDQCKILLSDVDDVDASNVTGPATSDCSTWEYDRAVYPETVISVFDLVCARRYLVSLSQSIYMFGFLIGAVGSGFLSDMFGRKPLMLASNCGLLLFGTCTAYSSSVSVFMFLRFCTGVCSISTLNVTYVYCMEMVGGRWSTLMGTGLGGSWSLAYMSLPLVAWLVPHWSYLQLAISLPVAVFIIPLLVPGLVPESPRWLLFHGKENQARQLLEEAAAINGMSPEKIVDLKDVKKKEATNKSLADQMRDLKGLFSSYRMCTRTIIMYYLWFTNSFVFYGLTLNSGSLIPGNIHINFVIGAILEIVAYVLTTVALLFLGRRWSLSGTMMVGGLCLLLTAIVESVTAKIVFAQIGKFAITGSFGMIFVYAAEMFPTVVRNVGMGSSSMFARVGGMLAPFIGRELGEATSQDVPIVIFGLTSLLAGLLSVLLPETRNRILPNTIQEGEQFMEENQLKIVGWKSRKQVYDVDHQRNTDAPGKADILGKESEAIKMEGIGNTNLAFSVDGEKEIKKLEP